MCRHERLRLSGDGSKDALLREADAVCTATVFGRLEARAPDLSWDISKQSPEVWKPIILYASYNSGRRSPFSGVVPADAAAGRPCVVGEEAVGRDLEVVEGTSDEAPVGDKAADAVTQPCLVEALGVAVVGEG